MQKNSYKMAKLVRDKSVENMEAKGTEVLWHTLPAAERPSHLLEKLLEEQQEVREAVAADNKDDICAELADMLELLHALAAATGTTMAEVEAARQGKLHRRGGFENGIYVDTITCPKGSFYDLYCAKDPVKYRPVR